MFSVRRLLILFALILVTVASVSAAPSIVIRNNYDFAYDGPVVFNTTMPDGFYRGRGAEGVVRQGSARIVADLSARSSISLKQDRSQPKVSTSDMLNDDSAIEFGLVVIPGREGGASQVPSAFEHWRTLPV